jgi:hypothetical protein
MPFSTEDRAFIHKVAQEHQISEGAAETLFTAVQHGNGSAAQFNHPELGGMGQWMAGGMTMVGDMFNNRLQATVAAACNEIAAYLRNRPQPVKRAAEAAPSMSQSGGRWWPEEFGSPNSSGSQNTLHYAYFAQPKRLAIRLGDRVAIFDTKDHQIFGVSQQQDGKQSVAFQSQNGKVPLSKLSLVKEYKL